MSVAGVLLAGGGGRRFLESGGAGSKLLAELPDGSRVVDRAFSSLVAAGLDESIVVTGSILPEALAAPKAVTVLHNPDWQAGQASSLQVALTYCRGVGHSAVVVGLADQPFVSAEAWRTVAESPPGPIVRAHYTAVQTRKSHLGHPVRLAAEIWDMLPTKGDAVARSLIDEHPEWVSDIAVSGGDDRDIDTVGDLTTAQINVSIEITGIDESNVLATEQGMATLRAFDDGG